MILYNTKSKLKFIDYFKYEKSSISKTARKLNIPKQTLARWIKLYKLFGKSGLENKKPGAKEKPINHEFEKLVMDIWKKRKISAYKMRTDLKVNGYNFSERQIQKVYKKNKLINIYA